MKQKNDNLDETLEKYVKDKTINESNIQYKVREI